MLVITAGVALALGVSIFETRTSMGSANEADVIDALLLVAGGATVAIGLLAALLGRPKSSPGPGSDPTPV